MTSTIKQNNLAQEKEKEMEKEREMEREREREKEVLEASGKV